MPIVNRVADLQPDIMGWRRDLHAHPELMYDVHRTAAFVADKLREFGCDEVATGLGRTGVRNEKTPRALPERWAILLVPRECRRSQRTRALAERVSTRPSAKPATPVSPLCSR